MTLNKTWYWGFWVFWFGSLCLFDLGGILDHTGHQAWAQEESPAPLPPPTLRIDPPDPNAPEPPPAPTTGPEWLNYCRTAGTVLISQAVLKGSDAKYADSEGYTALMAAAGSNSDPGVLAVLINHGANPALTETKFGFSALMFAAAFNTQPYVTTVLLEKGSDPNLRDLNGGTALALAATFNPALEVIKVLIAGGAEVNSQDNDGNTPLMGAASYGKNPEIITHLAQTGALLDAKNKLGDTALISAARNNPNPGAIVRLIKAGAKLEETNQIGETAFIVAGQNSRIDILLTLARAGANVLAKDQTGSNALFNAAFGNSNPMILGELLILGLDLNEPNLLGITPLMVAAANPNYEITRFLLIQGADPNILDKEGRTALMLACLVNPEPKVILALLGAGADPNIKDKNGEDAFLAAKQNQNPKVLKVLNTWIQSP